MLTYFDLVSIFLDIEHSCTIILYYYHHLLSSSCTTTTILYHHLVSSSCTTIILYHHLVSSSCTAHLAPLFAQCHLWTMCLKQDVCWVQWSDCIQCCCAWKLTKGCTCRRPTSSSNSAHAKRYFLSSYLLYYTIWCFVIVLKIICGLFHMYF